MELQRDYFNGSVLDSLRVGIYLASRSEKDHENERNEAISRCFTKFNARDFEINYIGFARDGMADGPMRFLGAVEAFVFSLLSQINDEEGNKT